jgi:thioredoxin 1
MRCAARLFIRAIPHKGEFQMLNRARKLTLVFALIISAAIFFSGCAAEAPAAPKSNTDIKSATESGKKTVLFFLNPNGAPCKLQNVEIEKLKQNQGDKINIVYVNAMSQADQQVFYDYGIRSLPSLVLIDSKGGIAKYFPPGIHKYDSLVDAINSAK